MDTSIFARGVQVDNGHGGSAALITNVSITNNLSFIGRNGADDVFIEFAEVGGRTGITTGNGDDSVWFDDSNLVGPVVVNTGAGNDIVGLDADDDPLFAASLTFGRAVTVNAGAGNDEVIMGCLGVETCAVYFYGPVALRGGAGYDTIGYEEGNIFTYSRANDSGFEEVL
jgi:hypothetical protein